MTLVVLLSHKILRLPLCKMLVWKICNGPAQLDAIMVKALIFVQLCDFAKCVVTL